MTVLTRSSVRIAGLSPNVVTYGSDGKPIYSKPGTTTVSTSVAKSVTEESAAPTGQETQTQEETPVESPGLITMQGTQEERDYNRGVKAYDALSKMIDEANKGNDPDAFTRAFEYARYHRGELENVVDAKELDTLIWDLRDIPINQKKTEIVLNQIDTAAKQQDFAKARILAEQNRQLLEKTVGKTETTDYIKEIKKAETTPKQEITVKAPFVSASANKQQKVESDEYGVKDLTASKYVRNITEPTSDFLNNLMAPREKIKAGARAIGGKGLAGDALEAFGMFGEGAYRTIVPGTVEFVGQVPTAAEYVVRHPEKVPAATVVVGGKIVEGIKKEAVENPFGLAGGIAATVVASKMISKIPSASKIAGATGEFIEEEANAFRFTREVNAVKAAAKGKSAPGILSDIADFGVGELKSGTKSAATKVVKAATSSPLPAVKRAVTSIKSPIKAEITAFKTFKQIRNVGEEKPIIKNLADYGVARTVTKLEQTGQKIKSSAYAAKSTVQEFSPIKTIKRQVVLTKSSLKGASLQKTAASLEKSVKSKVAGIKSSIADTKRVGNAVKKAFSPMKRIETTTPTLPSQMRQFDASLNAWIKREQTASLGKKTGLQQKPLSFVEKARKVRESSINQRIMKIEEPVFDAKMRGESEFAPPDINRRWLVAKGELERIRQPLSATPAKKIRISFEEKASQLRKTVKGNEPLRLRDSISKKIDQLAEAQYQAQKLVEEINLKGNKPHLIRKLAEQDALMDKLKNQIRNAKSSTGKIKTTAPPKKMSSLKSDEFAPVKEKGVKQGGKVIKTEKPKRPAKSTEPKKPEVETKGKGGTLISRQEGAPAQASAQPNYQDYAPPRPQGSNYGYAGGRRVDVVDEYEVISHPEHPLIRAGVKGSNVRNRQQQEPASRQGSAISLKEKQKNKVIVRQEVTVAPTLAMVQSQEFGLETRLKVKPAIESALSPKIAQEFEQGMRIGQTTIQEPAQSQKIKQATLQQQGIKQVQKQAQKQREVQKPKQKQKIKAKPKVKPAEKIKLRAFPLAWSEEKSKKKFPKKKGSRVSVEFAPVEMPFENMGRRFKGQKKQKQQSKKKKSVKDDYGI